MRPPSLVPLNLALGLIVILGLTTILSTFPSLFPNQLIFFLIGILVIFLLTRLHPRLLEEASVPLYIASLLLLSTPFIFGSVTRGSIRWIDIGPFRLQPSEIVKPFLIVFFAHRFRQPVHFSIKWLLTSFLLLLPPVLLVFFQPDLGSSLIICLTWFGLLLSSKVPKKTLLVFTLLGLLSIPFGFYLLKDYQKQRLTTFLNPFADPIGSGYNVIQSMIAIGSGQFLGKGVRQGTQSQLRFLPERHTDFAYASFAEEFGFLGTSLLLSSFFILLYWLLSLAQNLSGFQRLVVLGVFWLFLAQITINLGMNMGILPVTGITLPFVSYGGSSILSLTLSLGIVLSIRQHLRIS